MRGAPLILYIEDNPDNRKLVSRVLRAAGYTVSGVMDGFAGLEFVQALTPDLILIDMQLPGMDGYAVTRSLRQFEPLAQTPIVALTASVMQEDKERSLAAGCNGFIQKPINVDQLPQQVQGYLSKEVRQSHE